MNNPQSADAPTLTTLNTKPSWHNRAGRIDRSACFVLTASRHWRHIHPDRWTYRYPARQAVRHAKGKCDRYATLFYWARDLWMLHKTVHPYPLQGDHRSIKAHAMRINSQTSQRNLSGMPIKADPRSNAQPQSLTPHAQPPNPNRGVGFNMYKMLGLPALHRTTLRIERYVQHAKLKQHFFVCPVCGPRNDNPNPQHPKPNARLPGRVSKLYLPLCTPREWQDARVAELWLNTHINPNRPLSPIAAKLIARYSELFEGPPDADGYYHARKLRCRQCLGLRYGEVKPTIDSTGGRGSRRAATHKRFPVRQEPHPPAHPKPTEQSLFLNNLPKLLAKPQAVSDESIPESKFIDGLSQANRDKLLLLLAAPLPAFKTLAKLKDGHAPAMERAESSS